MVLVVGHPVLGFPRLFSQPFGGLLERVDDLLSHDPKTELVLTPGQPIRTALDGINVILIIVLATTLVLFLTEITSNAATATMILPVMAAFAVSLGVHPYALMVPCALAANCAFILPVMWGVDLMSIPAAFQ